MNNTASRIVATTTGALVLVLGSNMMSSLAHTSHRWQGIDLTASAHPTEVAPDVTDRAYDVESSWRSSVRADTSALTSATCDNCSGHSATLQVIYARWPKEIEVDNAAVAWSSCSTCGGTALSVQVVVVQGSRKVTANNRALATNAACEECDTAALAYQLVVATPHGERLSREATKDLRAWVDEQDRLLRDGTAATPRALARESASGADSLEQLVNDDLDSRTKDLNVDQM
ncbi:MAG: hypothetical protein ABWX84_11430 [Nocardioides sp.]